jgi:putative ABC transport system permease protein
MENISLAINSLRSNKLRAVLTMLGIIIGISSVMAIITLGDSLAGSIGNEMNDLGASNISVTLTYKAPNTYDSLQDESEVKDNLITQEMIDELQRRFPDKIRTICLAQGIGQARCAYAGKFAEDVTVVGINESFSMEQKLDLVEGRFVSDRDGENGKRSITIEKKYAQSVFGSESPIGKVLAIALSSHTGYYTVVGVYNYAPTLMGVNLAADQTGEITNAFIPLETGKQISDIKGYYSFTVVVKPAVRPNEFAQTISDFLNEYYNGKEGYTINAVSMESVVESLNIILASVKAIIATIAAISLVVGGIGVMNIMLVSITERTREIGIRKAIGAKNREIRGQFIVEAVIICLIGGFIGILLGIALGSLGAYLVNVPSKPSMATVLGSTAFSMLIGLFFGFYPASKAAKLDPIEALRYE